MANPNSRKNNPEANMALKEHLHEFKVRVIKSAVATLIGGIGGFFVYQPFIDAIKEPLDEVNAMAGRTAVINYDTVQASFNLMISVSLTIGVVLAMPVWLYQLWAFITPALYKKEKQYALGFIGAAVPMFVLGMAIAWYCLPTAVYAFTTFTPSGAYNVIEATEYTSFVVKFILAFGISFILPVLFVAINMMGLIRGRTLLKSWRWVVVLVAIIAAMAAPGNDIMTMIYLAAPLIFFFFLAIWICILNDKRRDKKHAKMVQGLTDEELNRATSAEELDQLGR